MSEAHQNAENLEHAVHGHEHGKVPHPATLAQFAHLYRQAEYKFSFKKQKITDPATGEEVKRPPVTLTIPVPTFDGVVKAIETSADDQGNSKVADYILELVEEAIKDQVRDQLSDPNKPVNRQSELDLSKLTLDYIANIPRAERTGGGISKDTWADWEKDYMEVMTPVRGEEKSARAVKLFLARFNPIKSDKQVIELLREHLNIWASKSPNAEDFSDVYSYLDTRATELMNKDSRELLNAL